MEKLLEEEMCKARKLEEYTKYRDYATQSLLTLLVVTVLHFFIPVCFRESEKITDRNKIGKLFLGK